MNETTHVRGLQGRSRKPAACRVERGGGSGQRDYLVGRLFKANRQNESDGDVAKVLVVDDHPIIRDGLVALVRAASRLRVSAEAGSAEEALAAIEDEVPDLVVMGLGLPDRDGIELLKDIHARHPGVRVLVFSMREESVYAERALRAGAHGYIMKHEPGARVLEAIRNVLRGEVVVNSAVAAQMLKQFVSNKPGQDIHGSVDRLSDRELQIFSEIGRGRTTQEIARLLNLNVKTIQTYREHIKRKLGLRNATDLIHSATQWIGTEGRKLLNRAEIKKSPWSSSLSAM